MIESRVLQAIEPAHGLLRSVMEGAFCVYNELASRRSELPPFDEAVQVATQCISSIPLSQADLDSYDILGRGEFGTVRRVFKNGQSLALKTMTVRMGDPRSCTVEELGYALATSCLAHQGQGPRNVLPCLGVHIAMEPTTAQDVDELGLNVGSHKVVVHELQPLCNKDTLERVLDRMNWATMQLHGVKSEDRTSYQDLIDMGFILSAARDVAAGLQETHGLGMMHCDLKADNVLVHEIRPGTMPRVYLSDLGGCTLIGHDGLVDLSNLIWNLHSRPMELHGQVAMGMSDVLKPVAEVWAVGTILLEMLLGQEIPAPVLQDPLSFFSQPFMQALLTDTEDCVEVYAQVLLGGGCSGSNLLVQLPARLASLNSQGQAGQAALDLLRLTARCLLPEARRISVAQLVVDTQALCERYGVPASGAPLATDGARLVLRRHIYTFPTIFAFAEQEWQVAVAAVLDDPALAAHAAAYGYSSEWVSRCACYEEDMPVPRGVPMAHLSQQQQSMLWGAWFMPQSWGGGCVDACHTLSTPPIQSEGLRTQASKPESPTISHAYCPIASMEGSSTLRGVRDQNRCSNDSEDGQERRWQSSGGLSLDNADCPAVPDQRWGPQSMWGPLTLGSGAICELGWGRQSPSGLQGPDSAAAHGQGQQSFGGLLGHPFKDLLGLNSATHQGWGQSSTAVLSLDCTTDQELVQSSWDASGHSSRGLLGPDSAATHGQGQHSSRGLLGPDSASREVWGQPSFGSLWGHPSKGLLGRNNASNRGWGQHAIGGLLSHPSKGLLGLNGATHQGWGQSSKGQSSPDTCPTAPDQGWGRQSSTGVLSLDCTTDQELVQSSGDASGHSSRGLLGPDSAATHGQGQHSSRGLLGPDSASRDVWGQPSFGSLWGHPSKGLLGRNNASNRGWGQHAIGGLLSHSSKGLLGLNGATHQGWGQSSKGQSSPDTYPTAPDQGWGWQSSTAVLSLDSATDQELVQSSGDASGHSSRGLLGPDSAATHGHGQHSSRGPLGPDSASHEVWGQPSFGSLWGHPSKGLLGRNNASNQGWGQHAIGGLLSHPSKGLLGLNGATHQGWGQSSPDTCQTAPDQGRGRQSSTGVLSLDSTTEQELVQLSGGVSDQSNHGRGQQSFGGLLGYNKGRVSTVADQERGRTSPGGNPSSDSATSPASADQSTDLVGGDLRPGSGSGLPDADEGQVDSTMDKESAEQQGATCTSSVPDPLYQSPAPAHDPHADQSMAQAEAWAATWPGQVVRSGYAIAGAVWGICQAVCMLIGFGDWR